MNSFIVEGPLSKWTNLVKGWQYRWFVLDKRTGFLSYYTSRDQMMRGSKRGCVKLRGAVLEIDDGDECAFMLISDNKQFHFQAQDGEDREKWLECLQETIQRHAGASIARKLSDNKGSRETNDDPGIQECLAEAEGYYCLLSDHVKSFNNKLSLTSDIQSSSSRELSDLTKEYMKSVRNCLDQMYPLASMPDPHGISSNRKNSLTVTQLAQQQDTNVTAILEHGASNGLVEIVTGANQTDIISTEHQDGFMQLRNCVSSSDSDSEFFDVDETFSTEGETTPNHAKSDDEEELGADSGKIHTQDPTDVILDEELMEKDNVSEGVVQHKSVIMHMASQVKVGVDLTRITLPTFILEKRSLLEMYAEFLSYPTLFASIPDQQTEEGRFLACVQYYLSTFSAARKGTIAKKPYNPILGEAFRCYWDIEKRQPMNQDEEILVNSGPIPWASYSALTFIAEQVSHHPPVSGFYAEFPPKDISVSGHNWTQSRYFGLSLGVYNVGQIRMNLHKFNEEYICTFPNAYGRSILTIPWIEIGGKCSLECTKTGYIANFEFHCKPFYGGKKHRVTADVFQKHTNKPILKLDGEWNGVIFADYPNGQREVFLDTQKLVTVRKKIKKIDAMDDNESRKVWRHLTDALKSEDMERATDAKHAVEEKQRADVRERNERGEAYVNKYFTKHGDAWLYNSPLTSRIQYDVV